jgi:hypothetical protein
LGNTWKAWRKEPLTILNSSIEITADSVFKVVRVSFDDQELRGVVVDALGLPVAGATVTMEQGRVVTAKTDADGHFQFTANAGKFLLHGAEHPDFGKDCSDIQQDNRILLRRGIHIRGRLIDPDGNPFSNKQLELVLDSYRHHPEETVHVTNGPWLLTAKTDAEGHFDFGRVCRDNFTFNLNYSRLANLPLDYVGSYRQVVHDGDWFEEVLEGHEIIVGTRNTVSEPVTGALVDGVGKSIADTAYRIDIERISEGEVVDSLGTDGKTDPSGKFRLGLWRGETYRLRFATPDGLSAEWEGRIDAAGISDLRIMLQ